MREERLTPIGSSGAAPDVALQPGTQPIQFHSPPRLTTELKFSGPVTHRHGQHTWHTHRDYREHQQPIDDEEIAANGAQCPEMTDDILEDGKTPFVRRCVLIAGHPGDDPRIHRALGRTAGVWLEWTDDEVRCAAYRAARQAAAVVRGTAIPATPDEVAALRERYELKLVAIDFAARGDWGQIAELVGHPDHPYWTPTLQTIADATERAAAALADRPDNFFVDHSFHLVGDDEGNDEYWVCQTCEVVDFDKGAIKAPWPCAGALAAQPDLARLNAAIPVGTTVTFRPNGVGDATVTTTRTPVWIAKDGHSYVSVNAYPPQSGAAVRSDSLCIDRASA
jgi:hypothetical protein